MNQRFERWLETRRVNFKKGYGIICELEQELEQWIIQKVLENLRAYADRFTFEKVKTKSARVKLSPRILVNEFSLVHFQLPVTMSPVTSIASVT